MTSSNIYDRGSRKHATGTVSGSYYTIAEDDTFYSIGLRFGLPWQEITEANNIQGENPSVRAGRRVRITGLSQPRPPSKPTSGKRQSPKPPSGRPSLSITSPSAGKTLDAGRTVVVYGVGSNLRDNKITVRVKDTRGPTLSSRKTTLDASGRWQVQFKDGVPVRANDEAIIEAESPATKLSTSIKFKFR